MVAWLRAVLLLNDLLVEDTHEVHARCACKEALLRLTAASVLLGFVEGNP